MKPSLTLLKAQWAWTRAYNKDKCLRSINSSTKASGEIGSNSSWILSNPLIKQVPYTTILNEISDTEMTICSSEVLLILMTGNTKADVGATAKGYHGTFP